MTVSELIVKLKELEQEGKGDWDVVYDCQHINEPNTYILGEMVDLCW